MAILDTNKYLKTELYKKHYQITDDEIKKIQQITLETASDVASVCESLHVPYTLCGGSVLGAIRHQGFIPWDDDMDMIIQRKYIDRVLDRIEEMYPEKYYVEAPLRTPGYLSSFIQVHRKGTIFREFLAQDEEHCGIKLDIFVAENVYNNPLKRRLQGMWTDAGLLILSCYRMYAWRKEYFDLSSGNRKISAVMHVKAAIGFLFSANPQALYQRVQKSFMCCKDDSSHFIAVPSGRKHFWGEVYERRKFIPTQKMKFEDRTFRVTKDYINHLTVLYGENYMQLPPKEKREKHVVYKLKLLGENVNE